MRKILITAAVAALLGGSASATVTDYALSGTLVDGVSFSGGFTVDDTRTFGGGAYSNVAVTLGNLVFTTVNVSYPSAVPNGFSDFSLIFSGGPSASTGFFSLGFDANHNEFTLLGGQQASFTSGYYINGPSFVSVASGTIAPANAVPEPATWALFIGGFGVVGASLRRRNEAGALLA